MLYTLVCSECIKKEREMSARCDLQLSYSADLLEIEILLQYTVVYIEMPEAIWALRDGRRSETTINHASKVTLAIHGSVYYSGSLCTA